MSYYQSKIPLSDTCKSSIIESIFYGIKDDVSQFMDEYNLATYNSLRFLKWDFINTNIRKGIYNSTPLECYKLKRGGWTLFLIYDRESKMLYSLMSDKNFSILQKRTKNRNKKVHYIDALSLLNKDLKERHEIKQLSLFEVRNEDMDTERSKLLYDILKLIDGEVVQYAVIVFTAKYQELTSVVTYIPTADLELAYIEDWSHFIPVDFGNDIEFGNSIEEDDEVEVRLRGRVDSNNENLVKLKKCNKEETIHN